ncbi:hypothetical protein C0J52_27452 [Blattella germanica]|nr:hypothetical protein C0J52_27452 [Blattella germanica]
MANTSKYTIEEHLIISVWVHEKERSGETYEEIRENFIHRFNKAAPSEANLRKLERGLYQQTGSVLDTKRSRRPKNIAAMIPEIGFTGSCFIETKKEVFSDFFVCFSTSLFFMNPQTNDETFLNRGRMRTYDDPRPGRPRTSTDERSVKLVADALEKDCRTVEKKKISATLCPKRLISKISRDQGSGCILFIKNVLLTLLIVKGLKIMLKMSSHRRYTSHGSFTMIVIKASKALSFSSAVFASITQVLHTSYYKKNSHIVDKMLLVKDSLQNSIEFKTRKEKSIIYTRWGSQTVRF